MLVVVVALLLLTVFNALVIVEGADGIEAYLLKINMELKKQSPLLFTSQQSSIIANFEQTFGVRIAIQPAFPEKLTETCIEQSKFFVLDGFNVKTVEFNVPDDGKFLNASVPKLLIQSVGLPGSSTLSLTSPSQKQQQIYNNECDEQQDINGAFSDDGIEFSGPSCNYIPIGVETYRPTQPFSTFLGESVQGNWLFKVFSSSASNAQLRWKLCYEQGGSFGRLSRDFSAANLNFPAFSQSAGEYYLTSLFRNAQGEALYLTIKYQ